MAKKKVNIQFERNKPLVTPKGTAVFPYLTKADTEYNDDGVFHTGLAIDPEDAEPFIEKLEEIRDAAIEAVKEATGKSKIKVNPLFTQETDSEGEETGRLLFKVKTNATRKVNGKLVKRKLTIVDSQKNPFPGGTPIYGGSVLKVAVQPGAQWVQSTLYITLYIISVMVVDLRTSSGGADLFEEEEGGYVADQDADPFAEDEDEDADDGEDEDDEDDDDEDLY